MEQKENGQGSFSSPEFTEALQGGDWRRQTRRLKVNIIVYSDSSHHWISTQQVIKFNPFWYDSTKQQQQTKTKKRENAGECQTWRPSCDFLPCRGKRDKFQKTLTQGKVRRCHNGRTTKPQGYKGGKGSVWGDGLLRWTLMHVEVKIPQDELPSREVRGAEIQSLDSKVDVPQYSLLFLFLLYCIFQLQQIYLNQGFITLSCFTFGAK